MSSEEKTEVARGSDPSVSVVIPLYNKASFVVQAIRSALGGTVRPLEVIVVDDGSVDGGHERVEQLMESDVQLIRQPNAGVSAARNRGLAAAAGDLIAFLDADDVWLPGYLESIVAQARAFPDCGLLSTGYFLFRGDPGEAHVPPLHHGGSTRRVERFYDFWVGSHRFCMCSCAFRREWIAKADLWFMEGESRGEDQDFVFRVADRWPLTYDPHPLVGYRQDVAGQLSSVPPPEPPAYLRRLRERLEQGVIPRQHRSGARRVLRVAELWHAQDLLKAGKRRRAAQQLLKPRLVKSPRYWLRLTGAVLLPRWLQGLLIPNDPQ